MFEFCLDQSEINAKKHPTIHLNMMMLLHSATKQNHGFQSPQSERSERKRRPRRPSLMGDIHEVDEESDDFYDLGENEE